MEISKFNRIGIPELGLIVFTGLGIFIGILIVSYGILDSLSLNFMLFYILTEELIKSISRLHRSSPLILFGSIFSFAVIELVWKLIRIYGTIEQSSFNFQSDILISDIQNFGYLFFLAYAGAILLHMLTAISFYRIKSYPLSLFISSLIHYIYNTIIELI